ncbi:MAG: methyltransferase [Verrucomicrobiia bacterium]|jgi:hypothetical protein
MSDKGKSGDLLLSQLDNIASGYRASQVLFAANRLGLFDALLEKQRTAEELSKILKADLRGTVVLCNALAGLGLIRKRGGVYGLSVVAKKYLVKDSLYSQQALLLHNAALYEKWGRLYDVVKTGRPVPREFVSPELRGDEVSFARAMASSAALGAAETVEAIDLRNTNTMLDIGGGPGIYAIEFARRQPSLRVTIMDDSKTLEVAQENVKRAGLADRIELKAGNALVDDVGGGYDLILISNVIHQYSVDKNIELIKRAASALSCGGRVCIKDFLLNPCRTKPLKASLFAVNMLVNTEGGNCYTVDDVKGWLKAVGLKPSKVVQLSDPSRIVIGTKGKA